MTGKGMRTMILAAAALSFAGAGLAQDAGGMGASGTSASATAAQDKMFVQKAGMGSLAEIQMAKLALQKSKNPDVKQFAQKMVDDHTMLISNMKPFADRMGVPPPTRVSPEDRQEEARLRSMSGDAFDKEYITTMVADHHKDLGEFITERDTTQNQELKQTVAQGTDVIRQHTQMADQLAQAKGIATPPMPTTGM